MRPGDAFTIAALAGCLSGAGALARGQCGTPWLLVPGSGPGPRYGHAMVFEPVTHRTILFGGNALGDTWQYSGATRTWSQIPIPGPPPGYGHKMVFDSARGTIILFDGNTWSFNPQSNTWTMLNPSGARPSGRVYPAMAYDSARHRTVLFGGLAPDESCYGDTWEFDSAAGAWTQRGTPAAPSPRSSAAMAFDSSRGRCVLVGGLNNYYTYLQEQWEWDGDTWQQIPATNIPTAHLGLGGMIFDPARAALVVFANDGHAWEYNAGTHQWTLRAGEGPGVRGAFGLAFDADRSVAVLQGGRNVNTFSDTWEWSHAAPAGPSITQCPLPVHGDHLGQSASLSVAASGSGGLQYQWLRESQPVIEGGGISGSHTQTLHFDPLMELHAGEYSVTVSDDCGQVTTPGATVLPEYRCYANCDRSTTPPYLNINDFICFMNRFAAGDLYANCDNCSWCSPPVLNVNDFICFQSQFAAGCP